ncbi:uncharacterized protein DS421_2g35440 [Arachis hypogaea]|nr:uncharacterized protein DS421_2g35440 [Arachis hypogaea]
MTTADTTIVNGSSIATLSSSLLWPAQTLLHSAMTAAPNRDGGGLNGNGLSVTEAPPPPFFPRRSSSSSANPLLFLRSSLICSLKFSNSSLRR